MERVNERVHVYFDEEYGDYVANAMDLYGWSERGRTMEEAMTRLDISLTLYEVLNSRRETS